MAAKTPDQPRAAQSPLALLTWCMIAGAVLTFVLGVPLAPIQVQEPPPRWIPILNALSHLLLLAGVAGLAHAGATGWGRLAASGLGLTMVGLVVLTVAEFGWLAGMSGVAVLYSVASLALMVGLVLLGVAVVRAGRWGGWRRYAPLACGLFIPLVMFPSFALPGMASNYAIGLWGITWLLVGVAQLAEAPGQPLVDARG